MVSLSKMKEHFSAKDQSNNTPHNFFLILKNCDVTCQLKLKKKKKLFSHLVDFYILNFQALLNT